jgi:hypothetical protein
MASTNGVPRPPFRIIEPNGAPIKNNTIHANDRVNFRCHSIAWYAPADALDLKVSLMLCILLMIEVNWYPNDSRILPESESGNMALINGENNIRINLNHPTKELIFVFGRNNSFSPQNDFSLGIDLYSISASNTVLNIDFSKVATSGFSLIKFQTEVTPNAFNSINVLLFGNPLKYNLPLEMGRCLYVCI